MCEFVMFIKLDFGAALVFHCSWTGSLNAALALAVSMVLAFLSLEKKYVVAAAV